MEVLSRLFGDAIPQPTASLVTKWRSDEYARGEGTIFAEHKSLFKGCLYCSGMQLPGWSEKGPVSAGSYSYVAVGSSAKTYDDLATPVRRRILFAGALPLPLHHSAIAQDHSRDFCWSNENLCYWALPHIYEGVH